jgi:hypothetical protein
MWMLSFIPDAWLYYAVLIVFGAGVTSYVVSFIPLLPYRELIRIVGTLLTILGVYFYGSYSTEIDWRSKTEEMQKQIDVAKVKSQDANNQIKTLIAQKTKVIHDKQVVIQTVIKQNAEQIDKQCTVDPEVITILNNAASGK